MKSGIRCFICSLLFVSLIFLPACTSDDSTANHRKVFRCLSLDPTQDYIFYEVIKPNDTYEIWAFDGNNKQSVLLPKALHNIQMTTPPNDKWLLTDKNSIYFLDLNACKLTPLFELDTKYKTIDTAWISKDLLLVNAFEEYPFTPDLYILDLRNNNARKLASDEFIQGISMLRSAWIQSDGVVVEVVQGEGTRMKILGNFRVATEIYPGAIQFLPDTEGFIFVGAPKDSTDYAIWKSSLRQGIPQIIFDFNKDTSVRHQQISPDGKYLCFLEEASTGSSLVFLNLETNRVDFQWNYPFTKSSPGFLWSPDSKFVAMPYEDPDQASYAGIQTMEISSGERKLVLETEIDWIVGWYSVQ